MARYNLTPQQIELLNILVKGVKSGEVEEPIIPNQWISSSRWKIDGIKTELNDNLISDLNVLCKADLLVSLNSGQRKKSYSIKQSGYDAVENNFVMPELPPSTQVNIGAIIHEMNNGNIQTVGFSSQSELQQTVNDPAILKEKIDDLTNQLLDAIKTELPAEKLITYLRSLDELKQQLIAEKSSPSILERLFRVLSFTGDIEGTISLMTRVWPYVYPLLVIASERLKAS
jgi:hypothetical protein